MLGALIIVFREVLEAGLIVGVVMAATRGIPHRGRWIGFGILAGILGACVVAFFAGRLASLFHGSGQELFNASVLFAAVLMLAWHNIWMASHGRQMAQEARELGEDVKRGKRSLIAVAGIIAVAVLREGSEVVLFLFGLSASDSGSPTMVAVGGVLGLVVGALFTVLIYFGLLAIPVRYFFSVTAALVALLAAGLSSQAISFLQQAGYADTWSIPVWNTSALISEGSWPGRVLHTLIGYTDQPTGMQIVAYSITLLGILGMMNLKSHKPTKILVS